MIRRREGERESGDEGREDRGRKYARHVNFKKFLTTKPLTRNHPLLFQNALKLTYSKVKKNLTNPLRTSALGKGREWKGKEK